MNEVNSTEIFNKYSNLSDQTKFSLNEIIKIEDYFNSEIQERKAMSKKLNQYIAVFDYVDKTLILLSAASRGASIISLTSIIGFPAGIASFTIAFSLTADITKTVKNNKK